MRIADVCTRVEDGLAIAALYVSLLRMLYILKRNNQRWRKYSNMLIDENRWRAQRYGIDGGLVDFGKGEVVPYAELLEEILGLTHDRSEEHTSELQSLMRISYAVFCLKKKTKKHK